MDVSFQLEYIGRWLKNVYSINNIIPSMNAFYILKH